MAKDKTIQELKEELQFLRNKKAELIERSKILAEQKQIRRELEREIRNEKYPYVRMFGKSIKNASAKLRKETLEFYERRRKYQERKMKEAKEANERIRKYQEAYAKQLKRQGGYK